MKKLLLLLVCLVVATGGVLAQGTLSNQVLALLSRTNSWIGTNSFYDIRVPAGTVPVTTTDRIYTDPSHNLYFNGGLIAGAGGGVTPHNFLSTTHPDTAANSPQRGSVVIGNATPAWARVTPTVTGSVPRFNGTDTLFSVDGSALTSLTAANLTGALPAISGALLTALNASNLGSGTVPLARLAGITNTEISGSAAIAYSKLALTGLVNLSTDTAATALPFAKGGLGLTAAADDTVPVSSGSAYVATAIPNCVSGTTALAYTAASNAFSCQALSVGSGTVTSVALALPAILTVSGSPVTTTGTLTGTLASQTQNLLFASPSGASGAPTFRAFVNADLPLSGVAAGTYPSVTVNTRGIVTAAATTVNLATVGAATILPVANGGLGTATVTDDTIKIGSGVAWVSTAIPNCTTLLSYSTTTNLLTCASAAAFGVITTSQPLSVTASWNDGAVTFNQFLVNVTDTASATASSLADLQIGGTSKFKVRKDGSLYLLTKRTISNSTPTISAGFGTSPAIAGTDSVIRVLQGTPVGATGTITFGTAFDTAPACVGVDETTTAGNPLKLTATTTTVAVASGGTMVAADVLKIICLGY